MTPTRFVLVAILAASAPACSTYTQDLSASEPTAKVGNVSHTSMSSEFRLGPEIEGPASWPKLNEQKLRLGGHQGHLGDSAGDAVDEPASSRDQRFRRVPLPDASAKPR